MKIKTIRLQNFQIHKNLTVNLTNGINVITGDNDGGKSSVIRAVNWVMNNDPNGDWMRKKDEDGNLLTAVAEVELENGIIITRTKGKGINSYVVDGVPYEDIGVQRCPAVTEAFNFSKTLDDIDVFPYLSMQDDPAFMVSMNGTERAAVVNAMTGIDIVENAIRDFNKDKTNTGRAINETKADIEQCAIDLEQYTGLDKIKLKEKKLDDDVRDLNRFHEKSDKLQRYKDDKREAQDAIIENEPPDLDGEIESVEHMFSELKKLDVRDAELRVYAEQCKACDDIEHVENLDDDIDRIEKMFNQHVKLLIDIDELETKRDDRMFVEDEIQDLEDKIEDLGDYINSLEENLKEFEGEACPTCGVIMEGILA